MHWLRFSLFMLIATFTKGHIINSKFVGDYFLQRGVKQVVAHACWNFLGLLQMGRNF